LPFFYRFGVWVVFFRTAVEGFADLCLAARPRNQLTGMQK